MMWLELPLLLVLLLLADERLDVPLDLRFLPVPRLALGDVLRVPGRRVGQQ